MGHGSVRAEFGKYDRCQKNAFTIQPNLDLITKASKKHNPSVIRQVMTVEKKHFFFSKLWNF
jgi:hypothetical protein